MSLTISEVKVAGQHSTPVDTEESRQIVEHFFSGIQKAIVGKLSIRPVHVNRHNRQATICAVGYEKNGPYSVELIIFKDGEPTGRPATLFLHNEEGLCLALRYSSPLRLYHSWQCAHQRFGGQQPTYVNDNADKQVRNGHRSGDLAKLIRGAVSFLRSSVKAKEAEWAWKLMSMSQRNMFGDLIVEMCRIGEPTLENMKDGSVVPVLLVYILEQFGFIEITGLTEAGISAQSTIEITEYCADLAVEWVSQINSTRLSQWKAKSQSLLKLVERKQRSVNELLDRVEREQTELKRLSADSKEFASNPPQFISDISELERYLSKQVAI